MKTKVEKQQKMTGRCLMPNTPNLYVTKNKTSIEWHKAHKTLVATRLVYNTLATITTTEPRTIGEFATRVNDLTRLSDGDFKLFEDTKDDEICGLELV